jgi:hypothetical protein
VVPGNKVVRLSKLILEQLYFLVVHLSESSARQANQMIVMLLTVTLLESRPVVSDLDLIRNAAFGQKLQVAMNRGIPYVRPFFSDGII